MGPIPAMRFKWRIASFVGDNKIKSGFEAFIDAWPALKFSIGANQYLLDARWQAASYSGNERCGLFTADGLSLAKPAQQILAGLLDKTQYWPISHFTAVFGVVAFSRTLLMTENSLHGRVDVQTNPMIGKLAQRPDPIAQHRHQFKQRLGLIDPQTVDVAPEGTGHRQPGQMEKTAQHGVQAQVAKVPYAVKPYKQ